MLCFSHTAYAEDFCAIINNTGKDIDCFIFYKCESKDKCFEFINNKKNGFSEYYILSYHPDFLDRIPINETHYFLIETCLSNGFRESVGLPLKDFAFNQAEDAPVITQNRGIPTIILQQFKQKYKEKYPDNYILQDLMIKNQIESYISIQNWHHEPSIPNKVLNKIKANVIDKYPDNYILQKLMIENQIKAYSDLHK